MGRCGFNGLRCTVTGRGPAESPTAGRAACPATLLSAYTTVFSICLAKGTFNAGFGVDAVHCPSTLPGTAVRTARRLQRPGGRPTLYRTSSTVPAGIESAGTALRLRQSMLLNWSDRITPVRLNPAGRATSKGYPLTCLVIGQRSAARLVRCKRPARARQPGTARPARSLFED